MNDEAKDEEDSENGLTEDLSGNLNEDGSILEVQETDEPNEEETEAVESEAIESEIAA